MTLKWFLPILFALGCTLPTAAQQREPQKNAPGVTDTEIKMGQTMPYSGPISGYSTIGRAETCVF